MSTTNKTSNESTLQYNPVAQGAYDKLVGSGSKQLQSMIQDPFGNAQYQLGLGQSMKGAAQQGANNMGVLNQNQKAQGIGGQAGAGWLAAQRAMTGRANAGMMSNANISNVMAALQRQMAATGMGMSFSPQLTGQKGSATQTTSGLGTWLPQLAGAGLSAAMAGMGAPKSNPAGSVGSMATSSQPGGGAFSGFGLGTGAPAAGSFSSLNPMSMAMQPGFNPFGG